MPSPAWQQDAIDVFIALANDMKHDRVRALFVSTALMRSCAKDATFSVVGSEASLRENGVDKLRKIFAQELGRVQEAKACQAGIDFKSVSED